MKEWSIRVEIRWPELSRSKRQWYLWIENLKNTGKDRSRVLAQIAKAWYGSQLVSPSLQPNILCRRLADIINSFNKVCVTIFVSIPINQLSTEDSRQQLKRLLYSTSTVKDAYQLQPITKKQKLCVASTTMHLSFSSLESMNNDYSVTRENYSSWSVYFLPQSSFPYSCKV